MTLLEHLRAVAASLRDFDHAPDHIEVDTRAVSSMLTAAADAIESTTKERDDAIKERDAERDFVARLHEDVACAESQRDAARVEVARLLRLATGPHINEEE